MSDISAIYKNQMKLLCLDNSEITLFKRLILNDYNYYYLQVYICRLKTSNRIIN